MAIKFLNTVQVDTDVLYVDVANDRVGIGTTNPTAKLDVYGNLGLGTTGTFTISQSPFSTTVFYVGAGNGSTITFGAPASNTQDVSVQGDLYSYQGSIGTKLSGSFNNKISYNGNNYLNSGNLGIGTTSPNSKLQVDGEIDANAGGGYKINGKPWANESSNNLNLGDWDGEGFTTTIYDDTSAAVVTVKQSSVGIGTTTPGYNLDVSGDAYIDETLNIETTISGTPVYGYSGVGAGNLVVGGMNFASWSPGVITLINQDTTISASQDLGVLQFGGKSDATNGYANGQIICTTATGAGFGNPGGGIFRFLLSGNTSGSGPTEKMRITNTGSVGIGTTSPSEKLQVSGNVKANNYINQRVAWNSGFNHGSNNPSSYYFIPVGYIAETTGDTYYNNWIAPYAGRVRKIVLRNTGQSTVPTATTVNFRVSVNGSVVYEGSTITVTGSGLNILASETLSDSTAVFSATDRVQVAYRTNGLWRNVAAGISLEYTE